MKQAERRKYHYIYKITRTDGSGKFYIGMHSTDELDDGYFGSGKRLWYSINKHGKEKHVKEILEQLDSREALKLREREIVNEELVGNKLCMNLKLGGEGGWDHQNSDRITQIRKAEKANAKIKLLRENSPEWVLHYRSKQSAGQCEAYKNGRVSPGWPASATANANSPAANEKRSATMRGRSSGEKNSQYGSCWVTNGVKPIKIKKEKLDEYLQNGYSRGRKYSSVL